MRKITRKNYVICFLLLTISVLLLACSTKKNPSADRLSNFTEKSDGRISCDYNQATRSFLECTPSDKSDVNGIIFMLHGYGSTANFFAKDIKFHEDACEQGYVVVYIDGIDNPDTPSTTSEWNSGVGASKVDDLGFIESLSCYMQTKYNVDKENTFVVGFSNGAFMTYRLAAEGQDYFKAAVSVAGMMPEKAWNNRADAPDISILQISGTKDDVVPMRLTSTSDSFTDPPIEDVLLYFADRKEADNLSVEHLSDNAELTKYTESDCEKQVWQVTIVDGSHCWPTESFAGFDVNKFILDFLSSLA